MQRVCDYCDTPFRDGEPVGFIANGEYKELPSKVTYAINKDFTVTEMYHRECLNYFLSGGR